MTVNVNVLPMYGKHFDSMYEGSMIGAGSVVFAVWGYVIANQKPDRVVGSQVDINTKLLAFILGESEKDVEKAVTFLCSPDSKSRSKAEDGRRLMRLGEFTYRVVNGAKYHAIRDEEARREQNREAKRRERLKNGTPLKGEDEYVRAVKSGDDAAADRIVGRGL
jgi:hypothetical protein